MCTSAIVIDIGIDECQSTQTKSELSRGRHWKLELEENYLLDVSLLDDGECGALDFVCNVAACEPAVFIKEFCKECLQKQRAGKKAMLRKTGLHTIFCVSKDHVIVSTTA
ncbi:hypothetical protein BgiBS90_029354 [Biomphalaria glabrata]|nr:hypothetical protein BgiBS90_029354 [Biomphalaria glabrata]